MYFEHLAGTAPLAGSVFPAHVGLSPAETSRAISSLRFPRACGVEPVPAMRKTFPVYVGVSLPLYVAVSMKVLSVHIGSGLQ